MNEFKMRMKVSDFDPGLPASISGAISVRCASRTSFSFSSADGSAHRSSAGPDVAIDDDFSLAGGAAVDEDILREDEDEEDEDDEDLDQEEEDGEAVPDLLVAGHERTEKHVACCATRQVTAAAHSATREREVVVDRDVAWRRILVMMSQTEN